jgi:hypothetical protein
MFGQEMTRLLAILGASFCIGMIFPIAAAAHVRGDIELQTVIIHSVSELILAMSLLFYCGFAALHSVSHVEDPSERMSWIVLTLGLNVVGSLIYYLTKYQDFRRHGMGGLIRPQKNKEHSFYRAMPVELKKRPNKTDAGSGS